MSTLAERLAAKARRRTVVPVAITDPTEATETVRRARERFTGHSTIYGEQDERTLARQQELEAAEAALEAHYVQVEFCACAPKDYERIQRATFPTTKDADPEDIDTAIPQLAALCASDESLRDAEWWATQLDSGLWSAGEKLGLWVALLRVNQQTPEGRVPFG